MYTKWHICCLSFHLWKLFKENKELPAEDSDDSGGWGGAGGPRRRNSLRMQMLPIFLVFGAFELPCEI